MSSPEPFRPPSQSALTSNLSSLLISLYLQFTHEQEPVPGLDEAVAEVIDAYLAPQIMAALISIYFQFHGPALQLEGFFDYNSLQVPEFNQKEIEK